MPKLCVPAKRAGPIIPQFWRVADLRDHRASLFAISNERVTIRQARLLQAPSLRKPRFQASN